MTHSHGHGSDVDRSPTYRAWESMMQRCYNPNNARYAHYGAKGINVCAAWHLFPAFLADMGEKPSRALHLGRIKTKEGYNPQNCRWLTPRQQGSLRQASRKGWQGVVQS